MNASALRIELKSLSLGHRPVLHPLTLAPAPRAEERKPRVAPAAATGYIGASTPRA